MPRKRPGPLKGKKHSEVERSAFGERLFRTRRIRKISQTELGRRVGISRRMVCHYEGNAAEGPPLTTLKRIADALGVTVSYLLGESTQRKITPEIKPGTEKYFHMIRELQPKEQKKIYEYVEMLSERQKRKLKK